MAGVYIHVPFCKTKCSYCDFYSEASLRIPHNEFTIALIREIGDRLDFITDRRIDTIYFGGGTPTLMRPDFFSRIIYELKANFDCTGLTEITVEANPDDIDKQYSEGLRLAGVNRVSMGVQSFDNACLSFMNRRHDAGSAESGFRILRNAGFDNISLDLIYGLPGSSTEVLRSTLEKMTELNPEHISAYHLTIEPGTQFGRLKEQGAISELEDTESERQFLLLRERLTEAGYEHYEVSNFAKERFRSKHNSAYWSGSHYLGLGPSAHSFNGKKRSWCCSTIADYLIGGVMYESEVLSETDIVNEKIMLSLRTKEGLDFSEIQDVQSDVIGDLQSEVDRLIAEGLLIWENNRLRIPEKGVFLTDNITSRLFL